VEIEQDVNSGGGGKPRVRECVSKNVRPALCSQGVVFHAFNTSEGCGLFTCFRRIAEKLCKVLRDSERKRFIQEIVKFTTSAPQSDLTVAYTPVLAIARPPTKAISVTTNSL